MNGQVECWALGLSLYVIHLGKNSTWEDDMKIWRYGIKAWTFETGGNRIRGKSAEICWIFILWKSSFPDLWEPKNMEIFVNWSSEGSFEKISTRKTIPIRSHQPCWGNIGPRSILMIWREHGIVPIIWHVLEPSLRHFQVGGSCRVGMPRVEVWI